MIRALLCALAACAAPKPAPDPARPAPVAPSPYAPEIQLQVLLARPGLADELAVSPSRLAVVSNHRQLFVVGWGGAIDAMWVAADAFAYTPDGVFLAIRDRELLYLDAEARLQPLLTLPSSGMGLASGASTVFLFDRRPDDGHGMLYELGPNRRVRLVLDSPQPIDAVAQAGRRTFIASGGVAFEIASNGALSAVAMLPGRGRITSLAAAGDRLYASDGDSIWVIFAGGAAALLTRSVGGTLRMSGDGLLVLDAKRGILARIVGLS